MLSSPSLSMPVHVENAQDFTNVVARFWPCVLCAHAARASFDGSYNSHLANRSESSVGLRRTAVSRLKRFIVSGGELERNTLHTTFEHKICLWYTKIINIYTNNIHKSPSPYHPRAHPVSSSPFRNKRCNDVIHVRIMSSCLRRPRRSSHEPTD